jgi:hypothetical protein
VALHLAVAADSFGLRCFITFRKVVRC